MVAKDKAMDKPLTLVNRKLTTTKMLNPLYRRREQPQKTPPPPTAREHQDTAVKAVKKAAPRPKKDAATKRREVGRANNLDLAYNYWSTRGEMDASLGYRAKSFYDQLVRQHHEFPDWVVPVAERMQAVRITPS